MDVGNYSVVTTLNQSFSSFAWIKSSSADGLSHIIVGKAEWEPDYQGWDMRLTNLGKFGVPLVNSVAKQYSKYFDKAINDNVWHFVGFSYDGTGFNGLKGYVDGIEITTLTSYENSAAITDSITNSIPLQIGVRNTTIQPFTGSISDVRIYNRALTAEEIKDLYGSYNPVIKASSLTKGLVGRWTLDQSDAKTGSTTADVTPYANDGTRYGETALGSIYTTDHRGLSNNAMLFTVANTDYIDIGYDADLDFERTDSFSVSVWAKTADNSNTRLIIGNSAFSLASGWNITNIDNNQIRFGLVNTDSNRILADITPPASYYSGEWTHIVFTYNGTSDISGVTGYVNGQSISADTVANNLSASTLTANSVYIGKPYHTSNYFNGSISDIRIYNRALSAEEVKMMYQGY